MLCLKQVNGWSAIGLLNAKAAAPTDPSTIKTVNLVPERTERMLRPSINENICGRLRCPCAGLVEPLACNEGLLSSSELATIRFDNDNGALTREAAASREKRRAAPAQALAPAFRKQLEARGSQPAMTGIAVVAF